MPGQEGFISFNTWTALFVLLNTITMFLVLKKFLFKPVLKMIHDRQKEVDDMYADAQKAKEEAQRMEQDYARKLSTATQDGDRIVKEAVARGRSREEEIIREANREADAIRNKAAQDIDRERRKAVNDAKDEICVIALDIAGKVVGRELTDADQSRLVDHFIDGLGEQA